MALTDNLGGISGGEPADAVASPAYKDRVVAIEPGGNEYIEPTARHGRPSRLFWTWTSPNLEFATVFVGVLAVSAFGMSFWQAVGGLLLGTGLGAGAHYVLSARGPLYGVPQMVLGRLAFGYKGNAVPAAIMSAVAGVGWFATNSVSGAFAINTLTGLPKLPALLLIVLVQTGFAFFGHNLVQAFEKIAFPILTMIFLIVTVAIFSKFDPSVPVHGGVGGIGGFLMTTGAAFGYAAGWTPYAADYSRYLPATVSPVRTGLFASAGLFLSCLVLEAVGAASATLGSAGSDSPTGAFTAHLPTWLGQLTLLAIAVGAVAANALNIYSGAMAFVTIGLRLPVGAQRAAVSLGFGVIGFLIAWAALADAAASYEAFVLIVAYGIGPWLGVMFADMFLRRGQDVAGLLYDRTYRNATGLIAFVVGAVVSVLLFSNQSRFVGFLVRRYPELGDITFLVGFLIAGGIYLVIRGCRRGRQVG